MRDLVKFGISVADGNKVGERSTSQVMCGGIHMP
jgi:hypothetical protein